MSQSDRRNRLAVLDQQIPQLRLLLERLEEERIQVIESLTFPILTLPVDVTTEIFLRCLPPPPKTPRVSDAPLLLVRICRQWRDIAISTPELWASLAFTVSEPNTELLAARDHLIERWLARSGQYPLSIRVLESPRPLRSDNAVTGAKSVDSCLRLLLEHSAQWRHVEIEVDLPGMKRALEAVKSHTPFDFPQLEYWRIGVDNYESEDSGQFRVGAAPQLRSIHLTLGVAPLDFRGTGIPWSQLTNLTGHSFDPAECVLILRLCPALVRGRFALCSDIAPPSQPILLHPSLEFLDLSHLNGRWRNLNIGFQVLDAITLPGLISLTLDCVGNGQSIVSLLTRSSCRLHGLALSCDFYDYQALFGCFLVVPELRRLRIFAAGSSTWTGIFTRLTGNSEMLPNLQSLSIQDKRIRYNFPVDKLLLFLKSRTDHPALRHFKFTGTHEASKSTLDLSRFAEPILQGIQKEIPGIQRFPEGDFSEEPNEDEGDDDEPIYPNVK
ncbi:hypothetical protein B0H16DRAFT_1462759 [Mycena metata]|uniref:F-box domain-containing protein n=1 Tax=Mycena metata TaxID=1033252 RepID=A0AAD7IL96_9AGAR|nr:hypothetical protein B0H16DRAFT_1462759 [Mycena metata]